MLIAYLKNTQEIINSCRVERKEDAGDLLSLCIFEFEFFTVCIFLFQLTTKKSVMEDGNSSACTAAVEKQSHHLLYPSKHLLTLLCAQCSFMTYYLYIFLK